MPKYLNDGEDGPQPMDKEEKGEKMKKLDPKKKKKMMAAKSSAVAKLKNMLMNRGK